MLYIYINMSKNSGESKQSSSSKKRGMDEPKSKPSKHEKVVAAVEANKKKSKKWWGDAPSFPQRAEKKGAMTQGYMQNWYDALSDRITRRMMGEKKKITDNPMMMQIRDIVEKRKEKLGQADIRVALGKRMGPKNMEKRWDLELPNHVVRKPGLVMNMSPETFAKTMDQKFEKKQTKKNQNTKKGGRKTKRRRKKYRYKKKTNKGRRVRKMKTHKRRRRR